MGNSCCSLYKEAFGKEQEIIFFGSNNNAKKAPVNQNLLYLDKLKLILEQKQEQMMKKKMLRKQQLNRDTNELSEYLKTKQTFKYMSESEPQSHKKLICQSIAEYDTYLVNQEEEGEEEEEEGKQREKEYYQKDRGGQYINDKGFHQSKKNNNENKNKANKWKLKTDVTNRSLYDQKQREEMLHQSYFNKQNEDPYTWLDEHSIDDDENHQIINNYQNNQNAVIDDSIDDQYVAEAEELTDQSEEMHVDKFESKENSLEKVQKLRISYKREKKEEEIEESEEMQNEDDEYEEVEDYENERVEAQEYANDSVNDQEQSLNGGSNEQEFNANQLIIIKNNDLFNQNEVKEREENKQDLLNNKEQVQEQKSKSINNELEQFSFTQKLDTRKFNSILKKQHKAKKMNQHKVQRHQINSLNAQVGRLVKNGNQQVTSQQKMQQQNLLRINDSIKALNYIQSNPFELHNSFNYSEAGGIGGANQPEQETPYISYISSQKSREFNSQQRISIDKLRESIVLADHQQQEQVEEEEEDEVERKTTIPKSQENQQDKGQSFNLVMQITENDIEEQQPQQQQQRQQQEQQVTPFKDSFNVYSDDNLMQKSLSEVKTSFQKSHSIEQKLFQHNKQQQQKFKTFVEFQVDDMDIDQQDERESKKQKGSITEFHYEQNQIRSSDSNELISQSKVQLQINVYDQRKLSDDTTSIKKYESSNDQIMLDQNSSSLNKFILKDGEMSSNQHEDDQQSQYSIRLTKRSDQMEQIDEDQQEQFSMQDQNPNSNKQFDSQLDQQQQMFANNEDFGEEKNNQGVQNKIKIEDEMIKQYNSENIKLKKAKTNLISRSGHKQQYQKSFTKRNLFIEAVEYEDFEQKNKKVMIGGHYLDEIEREENYNDDNQHVIEEEDERHLLKILDKYGSDNSEQKKSSEVEFEVNGERFQSIQEKNLQN